MRPLTVALCLLATPALADVAGVASVIDGDTIEVHGQRIRLHGIDAPESRQLCRRDVKFWQCGPLERGGAFRRHRRFHIREQVFDGEYLKAGELPERRIEHAKQTEKYRNGQKLTCNSGVLLYFGIVFLFYHA